MNVMYFSAPWCGPCKMFKPTVQSVALELGVGIIDINVDYDATYTEKYEIKSVPTLIITDNQGGVLYRNSGVMSRDQVVNAFKTYMNQ